MKVLVSIFALIALAEGSYPVLQAPSYHTSFSAVYPRFVPGFTSPPIIPTFSGIPAIAPPAIPDFPPPIPIFPPPHDARILPVGPLLPRPIVSAPAPVIPTFVYNVSPFVRQFPVFKPVVAAAAVPPPPLFIKHGGVIPPPIETTLIG